LGRALSIEKYGIHSAVVLNKHKHKEGISEFKLEYGVTRQSSSVSFTVYILFTESFWSNCLINITAVNIHPTQF
jgi:hypothetical protein